MENQKLENDAMQHHKDKKHEMETVGNVEVYRDSGYVEWRLYGWSLV